MTLWSFKIKNTTALIALLFKRLYKEYCHENSHLECQFTQRAFATSLAMAYAASTRCAGVARIKNGTRKIPCCGIEYDGVECCVVGTKNL